MITPIMPVLQRKEPPSGSIIIHDMPQARQPMIKSAYSQRPRLLLIEDMPSDAVLAEDMLEDSMPEYQWRIINRPSMTHALSVLRQISFDLALLDLTLPDMEGLMTVSTLHMAMPSLPIIVYSGTSDQNLLARALQSGARFYVEKDKATPELLRHVIRQALMPANPYV